jgi:hypothetical protein
MLLALDKANFLSLKVEFLPKFLSLFDATIEGFVLKSVALVFGSLPL